ncbi:hypothetical protein [Mesorhizobium sp. B2-1-3A]|uniref:hypothetical protein n=1 Tax=Mesorhizobium sp. B2-1-3A TaxID=2589971 RepID=UPI0011294C64|nr:hypothetical protein [Mesorhizobium sp. B2-1-3A]TPM89832.1 hypothetical protein FJ977_35205 [Mesorhizobium sp. B2-1-3A]
MNAVVTQDTPRLPSLQSGGSVRAIVPQTFDEAWRIANAVCIAGMAPKGLDTPEKAMVAIMHGMEVGFTPMAALQSIAVVNGRPTIWGDGALGLCRASPKCEYVRERIEGDGDAMVAICEVGRRGEQKPIIGRFSVADAKKASLWGKQGPWQQYPKRMLAMRARAFALRDGFADVLRGLGIAEEVQDIVQVQDRPQPPRPPVPPSSRMIDGIDPTPDNGFDTDVEGEATDDATADSIDADQPGSADDSLIDDTTFFERLEEALAVVSDLATVEEVWTDMDPLARFEGQPNAEINQGIAMAIRKQAEKRIGSAK